MKDSTDGDGGMSSPSQAGTGLRRIEWQDELAVVVLMLDNDVLGLASELSTIRRSSFGDRTADDARTEKTPFGVDDADPPDFLAPGLSPSPAAAAGVDP
jgi:hypothetical protein